MNIELELVITVIIAIIGSNALWGFLQFLLERKDKKKDCSKKILEEIQKINHKIDQRTAIVWMKLLKDGNIQRIVIIK